jgi:DNA-binding response OmpR family regulator
MHQRSILVVDDDPAVRTLLRRCLESDGYRVTEAADSAGVRAALADSPPDLITLDLALGTESGLDLARDLRRDNAVPIIMVTGKDDVIERIVGLEVGADDYLTKPFHVREVLARVNAVLRRTRRRHRDRPTASIWFWTGSRSISIG